VNLSLSLDLCDGLAQRILVRILRQAAAHVFRINSAREWSGVSMRLTKDEAKADSIPLKGRSNLGSFVKTD
jgi:hypothetical protein